MDPKAIEMNNLRVLNDYLNQTIDVLVRGPRLGAAPTPVGYSPFSPSFAPSIPTPAGIGTDTVYGAYPFQGSPMFGGVSPFTPTNPFTGLPFYGAGFGSVDPFTAQRSAFGAWQQPWQQPWQQQSWQQPWQQQPWQQSWQQPWGQSPWSPISEATRQAQFAHALAAKQSVLEAMCRMAGIPV
jgi:hypothetical protein